MTNDGQFNVGSPRRFGKVKQIIQKQKHCASNEGKNTEQLGNIGPHIWERMLDNLRPDEEDP